MGTYRYELTVPAGTTEAEPVTLELKLVPGTLNRFILAFPAGCKKLVYCRVKQPGGFSFPINPEGTFADDDYHFDLTDPVELSRATDKFIWSAWAPDTVFEHTLHLTLVVVERAKSPVWVLIDLVKKFLGVL